MTRTPLLLLLLGLPAAAGAQVVNVRAADHVGYTRVVVDFADRPSWTLVSDDSGLVLETGTDLAFDTANTLQRVRSNRIDAVVQRAPGRLGIDLNCDCGAVTSELTNGWLIMDIGPDAPKPPAAEAGGAALEPEADLPAVEIRTAPIELTDGLLPGILSRRASRPGPADPQQAREPARAARAEPDPPRPAEPQAPEGGTNRTPAEPDVLEADGSGYAGPADEMPVTAAAEPAEPEEPGRADTLRQGIVEAMIDSAERGVIDLADDLPSLEEAPEPETARPSPVLPELPPGSNILVETQEDKDRRGYGDLPATAACPAGLTGGRAEWLAAIGPVDVEAPAAAQARADAIPLIAGGLGAEARSLLAPYRADPEMALLGQLAAVADDRAPAPLVRSVADCGPLLSLFALIAEPPLGPRRIASIVRALEDLPPALKVQYGRRAIAALNALNRSEHADIVRNAVARQVPDLPEDALTPRDYGPGREIPTEEQAIRELADRTPEAADALKALIDSRRRAGETVPSTLIDQAAALLPELDVPQRIALSRSMIRAEIAQGSYQSAARRIDGLTGLDAGLARRLDLSLHAALIGIEEDGIFLQQAARFAGRRSAEEDQRLAMAERILALHVPRLARKFLAEIAGSGQAERLLRARIGIEMSDWDAAEAALAGLDGPEAAALRAEIGAGRNPEVPVAEAPPGPTGVGAESLSVIAESEALREKYEELLASRE